MPRPGKSKNKFELTTDNEDKQTEKRRRFAVVSGLIGLCVVVVYLVAAAFPSRLFSESKNTPAAGQQPVQAVHPVLPNSPLKASTETLFAETNVRMAKLFSKLGRPYTEPSLQLFEDTITSYQCGEYLPSAGSFYCPAEKKIYLDLSFFRALQSADSSSASQAQAYIVAHQFGHHIENVLGITAKIESLRNTARNEKDLAQLAAKEELLADYYAGVWAHYVWKRTLDDRLAEAAVSDATKQSTVIAKNADTFVPDPFDYVMLSNRVDAFYRGYESGDLKAADVFDAKDLK